MARRAGPWHAPKAVHGDVSLAPSEKPHAFGENAPNVVDRLGGFETLGVHGGSKPLEVILEAKEDTIPDESVDPKVKNFHWGDLTRALFEGEEKGVDTVVLLDINGNLAEGPGFNAFVVKDNVVLSPDRGALEGITRKSVFELCDDLGIAYQIRAISAPEVLDADEIFLSTTAGGIMPASRINGRIMGNDRPGPISMKLRETFWKRRAEGWHATPVEGLT